MACMEHWCGNCGHVTFNNDKHPEKCPSCNYVGTKWMSFFDEELPPPPEKQWGDDMTWGENDV